MKMAQGDNGRSTTTTSRPLSRSPPDHAPVRSLSSLGDERIGAPTFAEPSSAAGISPHSPGPRRRCATSGIASTIASLTIARRLSEHTDGRQLQDFRALDRRHFTRRPVRCTGYRQHGRFCERHRQRLHQLLAGLGEWLILSFLCS